MDSTKGKADERGKIPSFDSIVFTDIDKYLTAAQKEGKYVFIADMHGNTHQFMNYSKQYKPYEFGSDVKKCIIQKTQSFEDAQENVRKSLVFNMLRGYTWVMNVEKFVPDFPKYDSKLLPLKDMVFKREALMAGYKKLLAAGEDKDLQNNVGMYEMHPDFNLCVMQDMSDPMMDDEIVQMLLDAIPNIDEFKKVYILPEE